MILHDISLPANYTDEMLYEAAARKMKLKRQDVHVLTVLKRSIDARKKPDVRVIFTVSVNEPEKVRPETVKPLRKDVLPVAVIGAGPAGLFAAYTLLKNGIPVILLERGDKVETRREKVLQFWETGLLDPESNVQFGEGGAGTFSDGKLNTLTHNETNREVLEIFTEMGAPKEILFDAKPHVGTDVLHGMMQNFRKKILSLCGDVRFHTKACGFELENGALRALKLSTGEILRVDHAILSIGHSARDTFRVLHEIGVPMEKKPFALGIRIEHPQSIITLSQYGTLDYENLGAAPYKLTYKTGNGRGVYTFCMCPGGYVVNASSEKERLCINGMSYSARDSENANSALVVQIRTEDIPGDDPLSGIRFQEKLEEAAFMEGEGAIPVQTYEDFVNGKVSSDFGAFSPEMKGKYRFSDLNRILPPFVSDALKEAIPHFGRQIRGFDRADAILSAVEARTSCPVRILRDEWHESSVRGLYPTGEGAGYSGGIVSSAKDGIETARLLVKKLEGTND